MRRVSSAALLFGVVGVLLALFFLLPLAESLRGAFVTPSGDLTLAYLKAALTNPIYVEGFVNALAVAVVTTALATTVGIALAVIVDRFQFPAKNLFSLLLPLPLIVPPFVGALGVKQLLGQYGALNAALAAARLSDPMHPVDWLREARFWAVVTLTATHLYPIVYFNVTAALSHLNPEIEEAAENLGATPFRRFRRVTLPMLAPSLFAATTIVFIWAITELGVPLMCDYARITSVQILTGLSDLGRTPFIYALVVILLVFTSLLYVSARLLFGRSTHAMATKANARRHAKKLSPLGAALCSAFLGGIVLIAALPNVAVVLLSIAGDWYRTVLPSALTLDHFRSALGHDLVVPSIANSLRYVSLSTVFDLALGVSIAHLVVRSRFRFAHLLDLAAMAPLSVPGLVLAFGYLATTREGRPLSFLDPTRDPTALLVVAYAIRRLPFVVRAASAGLQQISVTLEEAAASLGASPLRAFYRVTLPLLAPHLVAGGVFAFALSLLEVSDSLVLTQRQATFPVTKAIYELSQLLGEGRWLAAALGVWAMLFVGAAVSFTRSALGRKFGGMFRI